MSLDYIKNMQKAEGLSEVLEMRPISVHMSITSCTPFNFSSVCVVSILQTIHDIYNEAITRYKQLGIDLFAACAVVISTVFGLTYKHGNAAAIANQDASFIMAI